MSKTFTTMSIGKYKTHIANWNRAITIQYLNYLKLRPWVVRLPDGSDRFFATVKQAKTFAKSLD